MKLTRTEYKEKAFFDGMAASVSNKELEDFLEKHKEDKSIPVGSFVDCPMGEMGGIVLKVFEVKPESKKWIKAFVGQSKYYGTRNGGSLLWKYRIGIESPKYDDHWFSKQWFNGQYLTVVNKNYNNMWTVGYPKEL
jgi:hypothetical protein